MFYSVQLLGKKNPLGKLWLAAHHDRRLKRQDINETSVSKAVEQILHPDVPLALRLSGLLLLGVVKIYSRQLKYLNDDCQVTLAKLDQTDKVTDHRQPEGGTQNVADAADITLNEDHHVLFQYQMSADEDAFGLFEDDNGTSSLAMAVEAHESFQEVDISGLLGSQVSIDEEEHMVSFATDDLDEPEQLRALAAEQSFGKAPMLGTGLDALLPQTPQGQGAKRALSNADDISRDDSNGSAVIAPDSVMGSAQGDTNAAGEGPAQLDDLPLPFPDDEAMFEPSVTEEAGAAAMEEGDAEPRPAEDGLPSPRDAAPLPLNADRLVASKAAELEVMQTPAGGQGDDGAGPSELHSAAAAGSTPAGSDREYQPTPSTRDSPAARSLPARPPRGRPGAARKRLTANRSVEDTTLPRAQIHELLRDRTSLLRDLPTLVAAAASAAAQRSTADLAADWDAVTQPMILAEPLLGERARALLQLSLRSHGPGAAAWRGEADDCEPGTPLALRRLGRRHAGVVGEQAEAIDSDEEDGSDEAAERARCSEARSGGATPVSEPELLRDGSVVLASAARRLPFARTDHAYEAGVEQMSDAFEADWIPGNQHGGYDGSEPLLDAVDDGGALPEARQSESLPATHTDSEFQGPWAERPNGDEQQLGNSAVDASPADAASLTAHTIATMQALKQLAEDDTQVSRKRKHSGTVGLVDLTRLNAKSSRLEAARRFYDVLVLQGKGLVRIQPQSAAYDDLRVEPCETD